MNSYLRLRLQQLQKSQGVPQSENCHLQQSQQIPSLLEIDMARNVNFGYDNAPYRQEHNNYYRVNNPRIRGFNRGFRRGTSHYSNNRQQFRNSSNRGQFKETTRKHPVFHGNSSSIQEKTSNAKILDKQLIEDNKNCLKLDLNKTDETNNNVNILENLSSNNVGHKKFKDTENSGCNQKNDVAKDALELDDNFWRTHPKLNAEMEREIYDGWNWNRYNRLNDGNHFRGADFGGAYSSRGHWNYNGDNRGRHYSRGNWNNIPRGRGGPYYNKPYNNSRWNGNSENRGNDSIGFTPNTRCPVFDGSPRISLP